MIFLDMEEKGVVGEGFEDHVRTYLEDCGWKKCKFAIPVGTTQGRCPGPHEDNRPHEHLERRSYCE